MEATNDDDHKINNVGNDDGVGKDHSDSNDDDDDTDDAKDQNDRNDYH